MNTLDLNTAANHKKVGRPRSNKKHEVGDTWQLTKRGVTYQYTKLEAGTNSIERITPYIMEQRKPKSGKGNKGDKGRCSHMTTFNKNAKNKPLPTNTANIFDPNIHAMIKHPTIKGAMKQVLKSSLPTENSETDVYSN